MQPKTRYAKSGDVHIAYQVIGDGPLDLVYAPPWIGNMELFWEEPSYARFLKRLASFSRLILFDKRGTGSSDRAAEIPIIEQQIDDLTSVMDSVGSERAALLGASEGGSLCTLFAATLPERTSALVLHCTGDRVVNVENGRYLARHIPNAKYVELPGTDHFPYLGDADAILAEIEEFLTGVRPLPESDRVLATVLFTDIITSTERSAQVGDRRWKDLLDQHDTLIRRELERHRGRLVKNTGDGILATFDGPARAIRCAQAIASSVKSLGIEVRAGLHTGEVELRGEDVTGMGVNIAARVMDAAGPGEVVVSSTVKDLVAGSGLRFADRGIHDLRGVPGEWRLFAVEG